MSEDALLADGFDDALLGIGRQFTLQIAVYDYEKCVAILMERDGMSDEDAREFMEFNVVGAFVGQQAPIFLEQVESGQ
jgi:hypothetical protein